MADDLQSVILSHLRASAPQLRQANENVMGFPLRQPYQSEDAYFQANPHVAGMAAEDNAIVLNPYSQLSTPQRSSVALNEAIRLFMRQKGIVPNITPSQEQTASFVGTPYAADPNALRQTLISRYLTQDPSAGQFTPEQVAEAQRISGLLPR